ncbi:MAG TPA: glycosyltransferase family 4 protein [Solirubrobacteraceae bacterium]|nr:glycosyltransferase family 4 protein [Solirubrobacteraceae bacterium]
MRVHVVDPSAYTPPYDHELCRALAAAGAEVELFTSRFVYGEVPAPAGYERRELFYRLAHRGGASGRRSRSSQALKLAEHVPDMLRYRRAARAADIVHFQWLTVQPLDVHLLPRRRPTDSEAHPPRPKLVLTAHDVLPREPRPGQLAAQRRLYERFDAVVVHSEHGRGRLLELGVAPDRVHVIPHGALTHLAELPSGPPVVGRVGDGASGVLIHTDGPVVLFFGLLRPYKGLDVLLRAWRGVEDKGGNGGKEDGDGGCERNGSRTGIAGAELWIAGMPRMNVTTLLADPPPGVRIVPRFISDAELPAYFTRADLVVLPYLEADQSGVLFTALAFGKPLLLSDVGGFPEVAATGAARTVPAGDSAALREALRELLADPAALATMAERARAAAAGPYSWDAIAHRTLELYRSLCAQPR